MRYLMTLGVFAALCCAGCQAGFHQSTPQEILQHDDLSLREVLSKQQSDDPLRKTQEKFGKALADSPDVASVSVALERSVLDEQTQGADGTIIHRQHDIVDFWVVLNAKAKTEMDRACLEYLVKTSLTNCGLEVHTFWLPGNSRSRWSLTGFAMEAKEPPAASQQR